MFVITLALGIISGLLYIICKQLNEIVKESISINAGIKKMLILFNAYNSYVEFKQKDITHEEMCRRVRKFNEEV